MKAVAKFEKVSWEQYAKSRGFEVNEICVTPHVLEYEGIRLPQRATVGSAGYDFFAPFSFELKSGDSIKIPTGIRCKIEEGYVLKEYPRSSLGFKYRLRLDNTVGIIDSDYYYSDNEGHIFIKVTNEGEIRIRVNRGEAFCQGILTQFFVTYDDNVTEVRNGGIGSTNK